MTHASDRRFAIEDFSTCSQRGFLGQSLAGLAANGLLVSARARTETVAPALAFQANPFALGVASGDPSPTGVELWTRVAPMPLQANGGMPNVAVEEEWEIAADERFRSATARGRQIAYPELGHTLHMEVEGLEPGRDYVGADLKRDFDVASASPIGAEILNLAVGSNPPADATDAFIGKLKADNPHIKFLSRVRGRTLHTVNDKLWRAEFRAVSDRLRAGSAMKAAGVPLPPACRCGCKPSAESGAHGLR